MSDISQETIAIVTIIPSFIAIVGYVVKNSLVNSIHEGFKNESWEKQRRWDLKQKMYFDILESLYEIQLTTRALKKLHLTNNQSGNAAEELKRYKKSISSLSPLLATSRLILDQKSSNELFELATSFKDIDRSLGEKVFDTVLESTATTFASITKIAKNDLKIHIEI